jgi:putative ABC transport system permease protein
MIPLKYNVRNLRVRWVTTLLTVLGTGLVVWSSCILFGFVEGLDYSLKVSGEPLDVIVLRKGSTNEMNSGYPVAQADKIALLEGIATEPSTKMPLVASEMINIPIAHRNDGSRTNIILRGVSAASPYLRPDFKIVQGEYFKTGKGEAIVSKNLSRRFQGAKIGGVMQVSEKEAYRIVGVFTAGGSAAESEMWCDLKDLQRNMGRESVVSSVQLRARSATDLDNIKKTIETDNQFKLAAPRESEYFANQTQSSLFLIGAGVLVSVLLTFGAMFASANTMFAAVSSRTREIGTMRALGFSRIDILISFLGESVLLCAMGGALGLLLTIPMTQLTFGSSLAEFAERTVSFRFGPLVMSVALVMTMAMGVFGGLFPALRAVRLQVISALREL